MSLLNSKETTSTRPYLIRAIYEWCSDNGLTPYVAVKVDETVQVPKEFVKDGEIVLNVSFDATSSLQLGDSLIEFKARFGGVSRDIRVPISRVIAIYARENGQGMTFPLIDASISDAAADDLRKAEPKPLQLTSVETPKTDDESDPPRPKSPTRPALKRIK